ncbi:Polysaccharide pyruvyl transferase [Syntrophus gentianae]|uniref:Polysaccharide pyruvyl transferase n=1 Tax=Syntrophus gentianae TaxID=43775 RepID=A0A1H7V857_9BACT|nr:polysaccharide pyruvyl transferase family protein [Syntrophus gentianae]SEM04937.1 Polysaccharide pyruvyl transferase [Syntrophus gentianae]
MNVGILTYHNTINYGASLQAYATQEIISGLGGNPEIIDYVSRHRAKSYSMPDLIKAQLSKSNYTTAARMLLGWYFVDKRKRKFDAFYEKYLKKGRPFRSREEITSAPPQYDRYIVGSDQVWNYDHNGHDTTYLLDFVRDKEKTASYASSFGLEKIAPEMQNAYKEALSCINWLSVREDGGRKIIRDLIGREAELVLDPVLLLNREQWRDLSSKTFPCRKKYVLVYITKGEDFDRFRQITQYDLSEYMTAKISRSTSVRDFLAPSISIKYAISPEEFLSLVDHASLVFTSSFHCTAFSIIFQKQFVAALSAGRGKDERIASILNLLGLEKRILTSSSTVEQIERPINYSEVNAKLNVLKSQSINFLKQVLDTP